VEPSLNIGRARDAGRHRHEAVVFRPVAEVPLLVLPPTTYLAETLTLRALVTPLATGVAAGLVVPSPSCPRPLEPQQRTLWLWLFKTAQAWVPLTDRLPTPRRPRTGRGVALPAPQQSTVPPRSTAHSQPLM
jgi:hypothetical protein